MTLPSLVLWLLPPPLLVEYGDTLHLVFVCSQVPLGQTYKTLGIGVIVLGAADTLMSALVIILGRHNILFNQWHTSLGAGAIILDAADKLLCV